MINIKTNTSHEQLSIVIAGHVDHGKSTIIGRLLADTGSLPKGKLEQVRMTCERNSKPFEYAFLLDALKDEQSQGITIDTARVFFKTKKRNYTIIDAPGHIEFLKNMITGASRAQAALLVIDAHEGIQENSRRHGYMLSMLGIKQITVLVNKMDLVGFKQDVFNKIVSEYSRFLSDIGITPSSFLPVSGFNGDNIAKQSSHFPWYTGKTVLEILDDFLVEPPLQGLPFRMPVQDVYKFTKHNDDRRIIAGTIDSGTIKTGDLVVFYPSGKKSRIRTIETFNKSNTTQASAGCATGFTLTEQIYIQRGELATLSNEIRPKITTRFKASIFWLGKNPMTRKNDYFLKIGTTKVPVILENIISIIDASSLKSENNKDTIKRHAVADCILKTSSAIAFDPSADNQATSRFVIIDQYEITGGGIIREELDDKQASIRENVILRNFKWETSRVPSHKRAEKYNQKSALILLTGAKATDKKSVAKGLEEKLFESGKIVYFLGIGNILYGVNIDIKNKERQENVKREHIRRLAEVANILLDAGIILIVTATDLTQDDLELIKASVDPKKIETIWIGDETTTDIAYDLKIAEQDENKMIDQIKTQMEKKGLIFKPW